MAQSPNQPSLCVHNAVQFIIQHLHIVQIHNWAGKKSKIVIVVKCSITKRNGSGELNEESVYDRDPFQLQTPAVEYFLKFHFLRI